MDEMAVKSTFLGKIQRNGLYCIIGALLLLVGIPLYQFIILVPAGYSNALAIQSTALHWISTHNLQFLGYRALLFAGFAFMLSMPFTLFRIVVAQEILGRDTEEQEDADKEEVAQEETKAQAESDQGDGMPTFAWRGKGFSILAAWGGLLGLICFVLGTLVSTFYLLFRADSLPLTATNLASATPWTAFLAIFTYTVGGALLAISCLFFGIIIARSGLKLWPGVWVAFAYVGIAIAILFSVSAAEVAFDPLSGQTLVTTLAILLFSAWVLWFGIMLVRLRPE
jgi:hypothetical protein